MTAATGTDQVWYTKWMSDLETQVAFNYHCAGGLGRKVEYSDAVRACQPVDPTHIPELLFFEDHDRIKASCRDAFKIVGALLVCSKALRDVLVEHDLGSTQLHEVPIYADEGRTPTDIAPHYLLHVTERKPGTFSPEHSEGVDRLRSPIDKSVIPNGYWLGKYDRDTLAVHARSAAGVDLWRDPMIAKRLFLSNRLKRAIEAAGLKSRALKMHKAKMLPG